MHLPTNSSNYTIFMEIPTIKMGIVFSRVSLRNVFKISLTSLLNAMVTCNMGAHIVLIQSMMLESVLGQ